MARLNDLIRCEDAIKEICKRTCTPGVLCPDAYCKEVKEWITDDMVVDAVPVVRCKDCKHHHYEKHFDKRIPYCDRINYGYGWQDNDYCSRGEWKDGDHHEG